MKVIMVSRTFPVYHPKAGQQTHFVEKIWAALADEVSGFKIPDHCKDWDWYKYYNARPKLHTMRAGNRWKVGDMASLRYWDGKPYGKGVKPVEFAQVEIKKVWNVIITKDLIEIETDYFGMLSATGKVLEALAKNDGLSVDDLKAWFKMPVKETFTGQIICWSDKVNY